MSQLVRSLERILADVRGSGRPWALVGGLAVSARVEPRTTRDVDLAVAVDGDEDAEDLLRALLGRGYLLEKAIEQTATGRLATVRLVPPGTGPLGAIVDLLFASSGIEAEVAAGADELEIVADVRARVASIAHLIAMKTLSRDDDTRPQDLVDLRALVAAATDADLSEAAARSDSSASSSCGPAACLENEPPAVARSARVRRVPSRRPDPPRAREGHPVRSRGRAAGARRRRRAAEGRRPAPQVRPPCRVAPQIKL